MIAVNGLLPVINRVNCLYTILRFSLHARGWLLSSALRQIRIRLKTASCLLANFSFGSLFFGYLCFF